MDTRRGAVRGARARARACVCVCACMTDDEDCAYVCVRVWCVIGIDDGSRVDGSTDDAPRARGARRGARARRGEEDYV